MEGFLLGFSSGWYCLLSCGSYLFPFLLGEQRRGLWCRNSCYLIMFLGGRLVAYILVGWLAGSSGEALLVINGKMFRFFAAGSDWLIAALLFSGGVVRIFPLSRPCDYLKKLYRPGWTSMIFGIAAGLTPCPPFIAAFLAAAGAAAALSGVKYFVFFYLGTSIYFLPLLGLPVRIFDVAMVRNAARLVMLIMSLFFLMQAVIKTLQF